MKGALFPNTIPKSTHFREWYTAFQEKKVIAAWSVMIVKAKWVHKAEMWNLKSPSWGAWESDGIFSLGGWEGGAHEGGITPHKCMAR